MFCQKSLYISTELLEIDSILSFDQGSVMNFDKI